MHKIVTREEWLKARKELSKREKEFTRERDRLTSQRQELPWVKVAKNYTFTQNGKTLALGDLFGKSSQLAIYHFMYGPNTVDVCKSCSFWADNFANLAPHLGGRDVTLMAVSRAPHEKLEAFKKKMGWTFDWVSSHGSDFNFDFGVSATPAQVESKEKLYNYGSSAFHGEENPGFSVFKKQDNAIFHTYSVYGRGLEDLNSCYRILDMVPKGRDEKSLPWGMAWLKYRNEY
jgi:predicted dithiol-disulfide oxidoreductase (DUF899 family)